MKGVFNKLLFGFVGVCFALTAGLAACGPVGDKDSSGSGGSSSTDSSAVYQGDECIDIEIVTMPTKLEYFEGERFSPAGLTFDAVYKNGYDGDTGLDWNDLDGYRPTGALTLDTTEVVLIFEGFEKEIPVTVNQRVVDSISITRTPDVKSYTVGDKIDLSGLVVRSEYQDGEINENETNYTVTDASGKVYESGVTALETANAALELIVTVGTGENAKTASFTIGVFESLSLQAEDTEVAENKSYTVLDTSVANGEIKTDCTWTGWGYLGAIDLGFAIEFHIYTAEAMENAELVMVASSTYQDVENGTMLDMQINQMFEITLDGEAIEIPDTTVIEGKPFPTGGTGNKWTNWADVSLGKVDLHEGYNVIRIECIGTVWDGSYGRTPNIDRLDVRTGN